MTQGLCLLTIDRPDKANALTETMLAQLTLALQQAARDGARAVILTGTGRVFSAGADMEQARTGLATSAEWERLSGQVAAMP